MECVHAQTPLNMLIWLKHCVRNILSYVTENLLRESLYIMYVSIYVTAYICTYVLSLYGMHA